MRKFMIHLLLTTAFPLYLQANNVAISNVSVINNGGNNGKIIQFDVSWENSWRVASTSNWDGVWIFFKFKDNDGKWYPLRFTGTDITMPAGATHEMGNNGSLVGVGMFIYRSANGSGNVSLTGVKAGIQSYPGTYDIRGYAIEMVYVPQGSFWVGDGISLGSYKNSSSGAASFQITGNGAATTMGSSAGMLYDSYASSYSGNLQGFPTGYSAFWMMKYELSQGGYRDFLNTLTYAQQLNHFYSSVTPQSVLGTNLGGLSNYRQYLEIATPGNSTNGTPAVIGMDADGDNIYNELTDGEWVTASFLTWSNVAAYLDWSGLRPLTELEYEKACRGPQLPVAGEYAWGTNTIAAYPYVLSNPNTATETVTNMSSVFGNAISDTSNVYLVRGGIFATSVSTRVSAGAGYYGAMELSGNAIEAIITTANVAGRSFNGKNGDGTLTSTGNANENNWPGINGNTGTTVAAGEYDGGTGVRSDGGIKFRGGGFLDIILYLNRLRVSDRAYYTGNGLNLITNTSGRFELAIRGGREAN